MKNGFTIRCSLALYIFIISFSPFCVSAQDSAAINNLTSSVENKFTLYSNEDTAILKNPGYNVSGVRYVDTVSKKRVHIIAAANIIGYGGSMVGLYSDWYSKYPQTKFHFFNDNHEWKQVDKAGHAYSAYVASSGSMEMWRWTGMKRKQRIWIGGLSGIAYQTMIETLDGFSTQWGWSWGDFAANVFGSGLLISQELAWDEQRIRMKFSFHKKNYGSPDLNRRADQLFGKSLSERMIKDYNGQTYWISANLRDFIPKSKLPSWLNVALGYGAEGMFGARGNIGPDGHGNIFNRTDVTRYRQLYISPDIDLTKIKTKRTLIRLALVALNSFKFPAPSLEYNTKGQFVFHFIHF